MFCAKCGKEIPDGEKKICEECEKSVVAEIVAEEKNEVKKETKKEKKVKKEKKEKKVKKEKKEKKEKTTIKLNKELIKKCVVCLVAILVVALVICLGCRLINGNNIGNTIGNIRNYGYAVEDDGWIYYLSPNEDSTEIGIFKIKNNGKEKQQLYMSSSDIVSLNAYGDYLYFIGTATETYLEDDEYDNKIYRIRKDGTDLEILNDNELNNDCYEIYVVNNKVYYIGLNAEICKMDLDGAHKTVVADNGTGYLGITDKYIIYNNLTSEADVENEAEYVTYIMDLDGSNAKPIVEGKRLYSVNIEEDYIYYSDADKKLYRSEIGSNAEETLYDNIETYNLNTHDGYAYYLNYLDAENADYTVCVYRVKLDGSSEKPENLKQMDTYSSFIDIVGNWVIYMDSSDEAGVIKLIDKNGNGEEIELYRLNYSEVYGDVTDLLEEEIIEEGAEEVTEDVVEEGTEEVTEEVTEDTVKEGTEEVVEDTKETKEETAKDNSKEAVEEGKN